MVGIPFPQNKSGQEYSAAEAIIDPNIFAVRFHVAVVGNTQLEVHWPVPRSKVDGAAASRAPCGHSVPFTANIFSYGFPSIFFYGRFYKFN